MDCSLPAPSDWIAGSIESTFPRDDNRTHALLIAEEEAVLDHLRVHTGARIVPCLFVSQCRGCVSGTP